MNWDILVFFFFQAEDGIRDADVTGVQTCALPISAGRHEAPRVHAFTPGGDPYCGLCGKAGHWRGERSCADAVVDELLARRRDDHVTAAITAHLADAGFRGHGGDTSAMLDSIIGGIPAVKP